MKGMPEKENAGEYSEEDTHRPVYCYPKAAVHRTFGRSPSERQSIPRERDAVEHREMLHNWTVRYYHRKYYLYRVLNGKLAEMTGLS